LDLISLRLSSQDKIRRKFFGCNLLDWADLRERVVLHGMRQSPGKPYFPPEEIALRQTKAEAYEIEPSAIEV
jgi:hypothetical protein